MLISVYVGGTNKYIKLPVFEIYISLGAIKQMLNETEWEPYISQGGKYIFVPGWNVEQEFTDKEWPSDPADTGSSITGCLAVS